MSKLHIITVATSSQYYLPYLRKSCDKNEVPLTVLGFGEKWKGFNWRFKLVLNYLKNLNENDIACFIDGYDVICTRNLNELPDIFLKLQNKYKCKLIVSEHKYINDNLINASSIFLNSIIFGKCNSKSLNAGTYIGIVKDLIVILQQIYNLYPIDNADDQILLTKYCNKYNNYIYVDVNNELFLTLQKAYSEIDTHLTFKDNTISYNNNRPFFIHGPGETYLDNIIKKIDYDYYKKNKKVSIALKNDYYKKILLRIKSSELLTNIISFIFIIAFLYLFYYHLRFLF
jgi:hypothetical protein